MRLSRACLIAAWLVGSLIASWSTPALACSCVSDYVEISWPRQDAVGVELDAPLVVSGFRATRFRATLMGEDGEEVPLVQRGELDAGDTTCISPSYWFLAPVAPLLPHTRYTLHVLNPNAGEQGFLSTPTADVSFVTGDALRGDAVPELTLSVYGVESSMGRLLELFVESGWPEPLFVMAQGTRHAQTRRWDPSRELPPFWLPLGAVACAEATILDVTGRVVLSETRCEPSKQTTQTVLSGGICGGEMYSGLSWTDWQNVPVEGADVLPAGGAPEAPTDVEGASPEVGCQLHAGNTPHATIGAALYLLACLARRRPA